MEREINLFLHLIGLGLLLAAIVAGWVLNGQYRKAKDVQTKAILLRPLRTIGLLSPVGMLILLVSGIGNMHALGYGVLDLPGWLAYKIVLFAIALISGIMFSVRSRRRGAFVQKMAAGDPPPNAEAELVRQDRQINLFYIVSIVLFLLILYLSVFGRLGVNP